MILLFGRNGKDLLAAGEQLRAEGKKIILGNPAYFKYADIQHGEEVVMLEEYPKVREGYERLNEKLRELGKSPIKIRLFGDLPEQPKHPTLSDLEKMKFFEKAHALAKILGKPRPQNAIEANTMMAELEARGHPYGESGIRKHTSGPPD